MKLLKFKISKPILFAVLIGIFACPLSMQASFSVSPPVIDDSGVPRDSVSGSVTLTNRTDNRRIRIFTFVNNVSFGGDSTLEDFTVLSGLDTAESLANWVSITRQEIVLAPGESRDIPVTVDIHREAKPGKYHAFISFSEGARRSEAEGGITRDRAVLLAIEVKDDSEDILNLLEFSTEERVVTGSPVGFLVILNNRGDTTLVPDGELSVYDKRGREIGAVAFNEEGLTVEPEEEREFKVLWEGDLDWGKHRVRLTANYGSMGRRYTLNDTFFFTVTPIVPLALVFFSLLLIIIFVTHLIHERQKRATVYETGVGSRRRISDDEESDENTIDLRGW